MQVAVAEAVAVAALMDDDAFPSARRVVVGQVVEHVVHPVAAQYDRLLQTALYRQLSVDMQRRLVVEHEPCALAESQLRAFLHHERVVDDVGLVGQERCVLVDDHALRDVGVNGASGQDDSLLRSVLQQEVKFFLEVERLRAAHFGRRHLDAYDETVVPEHLEVVPDAVGQEASVHVDAEVTCCSALEQNGTDAHAVAVLVEGIERLGAARNGAHQRVEGNGVLREGEPEVRIVRKALVVRAGHGQKCQKRQ